MKRLFEMLARECSFKNAGIAAYVEAFGTVLSSKQTRIWSSYLSNDVLVSYAGI